MPSAKVVFDMNDQSSNFVATLLRAYWCVCALGGAIIAFMHADGGGFVEGVLAWMIGAVCTGLLLLLTAPLSGPLLLLCAWLGHKLASPAAPPQP
jgi:hypothetical protein